MNPLFIIPARGGSKGIPRKNIKPLNGRPLIHYAIDAAMRLAPAERIILSTDDEEIAEVGRRGGLPVEYMRPPELAGDTTGSREVILDAMDWAAKRGIAYDTVVLLQPTSPMRTATDIRRCMEAYQAAYPDVDMAVTVCEAAANPYYDCFETDAEGHLRISKGDGSYTRRQDAPRAWQYNGAVYVIRPDSIRALPLGKMPRIVPCEMPRECSVDLDTPLDWIIAETLMKNLAHNE